MLQEYLQAGGLTHIHTNLSKDGRYSMGEISQFIGTNLKSEYFTVADHLTSPYSEKPYSEEESALRVKTMLDAVEKCNLEFPARPQCISGVEVNIKTSGLDIPDVSLEKIDFVVASRHFPWGNESKSVFEENMTQAMRNQNVDVIGHIDRYAPQQVDWKKLLETARETNTIVEINYDSPPSHEILCHIKELQLPVTLGVDFHTFGGWSKNNVRQSGIEIDLNKQLGFKAIRQAVLVTRQVVNADIKPNKIVNLKNKSDFINLLNTKKYDRKF